MQQNKEQFELILSILRKLVGFDTQNPPRDLTKASTIFQFLSAELDDFVIQITDNGNGCVNFYAKRGNPTLLFNVHLDTVPAVKEWSSSPHELLEEEDRVIGLGSCDIKGAAACLVALAKQDERDLAFLFTTDEEGANGVCISRFIEAGLCAPYSQAVVAEPTNCQAITEHCGFLSVGMQFTGVAGHSSNIHALRQSANHHLATWAQNSLNYVNANYQNNETARFNIGIMTGGLKSNITSDNAYCKWSARLAPGSDMHAFLADIKACAPEEATIEWQTSFTGPPLPTADTSTDAALNFVQANNLDMGQPVGFWTEASLFNAAGLPAIVLGPGDIAQAHTANEFVLKEQLLKAYSIYKDLSEAK